MQIEAIYENGRLKFLSPVTFTQTRFQVRVEVPPDVIASNDNNAPNDQNAPNDKVDTLDLDDYARELVARLDAIRNAPSPADESLPRFTPKQHERVEAAALREEFRKGV
jgi:predicted DNA-binding antitoxin AbrB/MazE fold protein